MLDSFMRVPGYQLLYLLSIMAAAAVILADGRRRGFDADRWMLATTLWVVGGVLGATVPHLILGDLAATRTAVGAVAGATLALLLAVRLLGIRGGSALDATAVAIPIGGAVARLGCFIADCCRGVVTSLPVGVTDHDGILRHPAQVYEAGADLLIALFISRRTTKPGAEGRGFLISLGAMSVARFTVEFVRDSDKLGPFSLAQWIVGAAAIVCGVALTRPQVPSLSLPQIDGRVPFFVAALIVAMLAATGTIRALEASAITLAACACVAMIAARRRRLTETGMAALLLQVPVAAPDTVYPQRFRFWGLGFTGGAYTLSHEDDHGCDSGPFNEWTRRHHFYGGSVEAGALRKGSEWSGRGVRGRAHYSADIAEQARATAGNAPRPSPYTVHNVSAGLFADMIGRYGALTLGGNVGFVRPILSGFPFISESDPPQVWVAYPAAGLRLGPLAGPSLEFRFGDEAPTNVPGPMMTLTVGVGDSKGNRLRAGLSETGYFGSAVIRTKNGLELMPSLYFMQSLTMATSGGGMAVRQWTRVLPPER